MAAPFHIPSPLINRSKIFLVKKLKLYAKKRINYLRNKNREAEDLLRKLLEIDPHVQRQNEYMLYCEGLDNHILRICKGEAQAELQESWLSAIPNKEHEAIPDTLEHKKMVKSIGLAATTVEGMKLTERRKCCEEEECCTICMEELRLVRVASCSYLFHGKCLFKWLTGHADPI